ncbi:Crp/Fnr family transcriptional regulator [Halorhodospira halophila]|uniref:Transcriptional regulator, Crp/Fnr family n=1 Tax=Halorhodospira halophila (strain DSM 244 / SL1) TaxID=349124 RepID=A1WU29_HALHL|nr:Crp/Fnr family transcriptional regulator [Halorhodospira halophila]ABM61191.1 transcriptional regulator, Crp/Fnr family [Halorhodospira halophila SL1]MBK1729616.1 Crp/Fnr family transcriptional regulator [Halorhodospira halophila]
MKSGQNRTPDGPAGNQLLAALPPDEFKRLLPNLERVALPLDETVCEAYFEMKYVYFPVDCIVSLLGITEDGGSAEISVVGNEGIVGVSLFMGGETTPARAVVQAGGQAYRLSGNELKEEFYRGGPMQRLLLRYTQALLTQMAQTVICNRHHTLDQQLCRWLLLSMDRLGNNHLMMTQGLIANMLGVRREGVTEAAGKLQKSGLISYHRGHIEILDREGLEDRTCECYGVVRREYDRLLTNFPQS